MALQHFDGTGPEAFIRDPHASSGSNWFRLAHARHDPVDLCATPRVISVALVRISGSSAPVDCLVEMLPESDIIASEEYFVGNGGQEILLMTCGVIEPGETSGV